MSAIPLAGSHFDRGDDDSLFGKIAEAIRAQGYCIAANALPEQLAHDLFMQVQQFSAYQFSPAGVGRHRDLQQNEFVRRDEIRWIEGETSAEQDWFAWTACLQAYLNRNLLLGLFSFESHFAHYGVGAFYKKHVDAFRGEANRILSVVAYLNPGWLPENGGELVLYGNSDTGEVDEALIKVTPAYGTLMVFLAEEFPHEVLPANRDRYSIAGWFRVNNSVAQRVDPPR